MLYPAQVGMEVMINTRPVQTGVKDGSGEYGLIVDCYEHKGDEYFVIDMGNGQELHFTREHFDVVEEP